MDVQSAFAATASAPLTCRFGIGAVTCGEFPTERVAIPAIETASMRPLPTVIRRRRDIGPR
jgi:hypothetical protein